MWHHPAKFQPPTPSSSKVITKSVHFYSFQDPCSDSFQDHHFLSRPLYCAKYWVIRICHMSEREITRTNLLSRPSYEYRYSFQWLNLREMKNLVHFKTFVFSLITAQWQAETSYFSHPPQVRLTCRGPATCICRVERQDRASSRSVQHQKGHMVRNDCRLPR